MCAVCGPELGKIKPQRKSTKSNFVDMLLDTGQTYIFIIHRKLESLRDLFFNYLIIIFFKCHRWKGQRTNVSCGHGSIFRVAPRSCEPWHCPWRGISVSQWRRAEAQLFFLFFFLLLLDRFIQRRAGTRETFRKKRTLGSKHWLDSSLCGVCCVAVKNYIGVAGQDRWQYP